jgi:hypothetical protein
MSEQESERDAGAEGHCQPVFASHCRIRTRMTATIYTAPVVLASQPTTADKASLSVAPWRRAIW